MKKNITVLLCIYFFGSISLKTYAQNQDLWQWTTFSIEKKLTSRASLTFDEEFRLSENLSRINLFYSNFGFNYKLNKYFKIATIYRFIQKNNDGNDYSSRHRIMFDLIFKHKIKKITLGYRARLQSQVRDVLSSDDGTTPESYWRNKFDLKYKIGGKFIPYLAAEFRYQFPNPRLREANNEFNRGRYYIGCDYEKDRVNTFGLYYMIQKEFNINEAETDYVIGVQYAITLK